jgi:hypothetical protein
MMTACGLCTLTCATRRGWMRCSSRRSMLCSPLRRCIGFRRVLCTGYTAISLAWSARVESSHTPKRCHWLSHPASTPDWPTLSVNVPRARGTGPEHDRRVEDSYSSRDEAECRRGAHPATMSRDRLNRTGSAISDVLRTLEFGKPFALSTFIVTYRVVSILLVGGCLSNAIDNFVDRKLPGLRSQWTLRSLPSQ